MTLAEGRRNEKTWTEANQRLLVAEFDLLKERLADAAPEATTETATEAMTEATTEATTRASDALERARAELTGSSAIDSLATLFGLSRFEKAVLLLVAGVEMDTAVARLCGEAVGRPDSPWATFGLALARLPDAHWSALTPAAPLRHWRLVEVEEGAALTAGRLRIDERVLHYLAGLNYLDPRLQPLLETVQSPDFMSEEQQATALEIARLVASRVGELSVVGLHGDDRFGQQDVAARAAQDLGIGLYAIAAADVPAVPHELDALATLWQREAALAGDALLVEQVAVATAPTVQRFVDRIGGLVFVASRAPVDLSGEVPRFSVEKPEAPEQRRLWGELLADESLALAPAIDGLAGQYRLSARTIGSAVRQFHSRKGGELAADELLATVCRDMDVIRLDTLAERIEPRASWSDLMLPAAQKGLLHEIAGQVRQRLRVYHDWGFARKSARGLGISALFSGESGTGKTMAAEVLARDLGLDLYRIDLSAVVSKYIGETEKNLGRVFDAAEESGAILLFDEADALFGKRSEVKDSHDRYANIEVSYLLQRMEAYRGLAVLTTNLKASLDTAFQRRIRFVVQFPFPDATQREAIWRTVFPADAPLNGVAFEKLARLDASGGVIKNVAINAAFLAAEAGVPVGMRHLLKAAHADAAKRDRPISDAETRGWV